jgi:hypothetical protein
VNKKTTMILFSTFPKLPILLVLLLLKGPSILAQEIKYTISVPSGAGLGVEKLPEIIDVQYYCASNEIKDMAVPVMGWSKFYSDIKKLDYPESAKKEKIKTLIVLTIQIDENGNIDNVIVSDSGNMVCKDCEKLIIDFVKHIKWLPGKIGDIHVKTSNSLMVAFSIYNPAEKSTDHPFGF